ncbi:hypothetical protein ACWGJT_03185 [Streptomyces xantholiticus]
MIRRSRTLNYGHKSRSNRVGDSIVKRIAKRRERRLWVRDMQRGG